MKAYIEYIQCIILHIVYLITLGILLYCFSSFPRIVNTILNYQNRSAFTIFCWMMINHSTLEYHVTNFNTFFRWLWQKNQNPNTLL